MNLRNRNLGRYGLAALALILALAATRPSAAQGAFYAEEEREGRIYVFNDMKSYEIWKNGGELGVSITRPGGGPNGETMVFDSDQAIHLYNLRHDRPGEVLVRPEEKKPVMKFSWKDGKTSFESDTATLVLSNRIQVRYTHEDPDGGDQKGSFRIRRAKTRMDGWIYSKKLTYELQLNWPDTANPLELANMNYDFTGTKSLQLRAGQFKVPFGRQELTSSGNQQFVDRSLVSNEFAKAYDIGIQLWGLALGEKLDWRVGVFNGNGRTKAANDNDEFQYNARVTFQPFGDVKYSESDFESADRPLFAFAAQYEDNDLHGATTADDIAREIVGADVVFKFKGLSVFAEYFQRDNDPELAADFESTGYNAQIGYFILPGHLEMAVRYAVLEPTDLRSNGDRIESGIAVSWYWNKHNLKLQADCRQIEDEFRDTKDREARLQVQFIF